MSLFICGYLVALIANQLWSGEGVIIYSCASGQVSVNLQQ